MAIRVCPCGSRLVQKTYESAAQFEKRKYCDSKCKGKYHRDPPRQRGFGLIMPRDKTVIRARKGIQAYLDERPFNTGN